MTSIPYFQKPDIVSILFFLTITLITIGTLMLDKIMSAFKRKTSDEPQEDTGKPVEASEKPVEASEDESKGVGTPETPEAVEDDSEASKAPAEQPSEEEVKDWSERLQAFVYDPELSAELAPVFATLSAVEGFSKILELLETKEKQIEAIGTSRTQQSAPESVVTQTEAKTVSATDILKARYSKT